jgi:L-threonylcarbamoyladenylate synthase
MQGRAGNERREFPDEIERACHALSSGGAIVYPTETLYGLGVDATNPRALQRLVELKVRDAGKPISVLVAHRAMLDTIVCDISPMASKLMRKFWPGPLTLVLPARLGVSELLTAGRGGIGVRISSHPVAQSLVERFGRPITAPSANPAGATPPRTVDTARNYFGQRVDLYLDAGMLRGEPASTVVEVNGDPRLIREGAVSWAELQEALR